MHNAVKIKYSASLCHPFHSQSSIEHVFSFAAHELESWWHSPENAELHQDQDILNVLYHMMAA